MQRRSLNKAGLHRERETLTGLGRLVVPGYEARLHWYQKLIAEALEGLLRFVRFKGQKGGYARVAISMPSRHGKSLHGVELFPALALGLYPDMKIMVGTNAAALARKSVTNTKRYMQAAAYKQRYDTRVGKVQEFVGDSKSGKLDVENTTLMFRTLKAIEGGSRYAPAEGYYKAQGMGGSFIGEGFDIGIMDDLIKNAEQALSDAWLQKAWDFYASTFATRGDHPWAGQLYIGHRWTTPDFVEELVALWRSQSNPGHELPVKVLKFPALAEEGLLEDYDPREIGEGLDKESIHPAAAYVGTRNALLSRRPWVWAGMYQQNPSFSGAKLFQPEDWSWYNKTFKLRERLVLVDFSIDAALSESGNSFTVINVFGYLCSGSAGGRQHAGEHFFWLDERRGHWTIEQLYQEFEYLWRKWSRALPEQFNPVAISLADMSLSDEDAQPRVWVENKALGPNFISRYVNGYARDIPSDLSDSEMQAVAEAIYPVPKAQSKPYCYKTASQVTSLGRMWLPRESFGEDPLDPSRPLVDVGPLGVVWEEGEDGKFRKVKSSDYEGKWIHELGNHPSEPNDRRDVVAQQIICRTPWLGVDLMRSR